MSFPLQTQAVATAIENKDFDKAVSLRDAEFSDMLTSFYAGAESTQKYYLPEDQRMRIGIIQCVLSLPHRQSSIPAPAQLTFLLLLLHCLCSASELPPEE